ncbi:YfgM family protein [Halomonas binhaiensis]|uniref:Ancillary SecYEG translocon subunit n=1 Tax=Halomonas binhaiensis TaxID=2562282 RepID=A0A5C1NN16_9GAMM|nr:tetratricopeptide repeat protein [Halomonas binhaiensis]QEM83199.1 tetratricopeptide repeat protein [Halomonas binhaiensis]
MADLRSEEEQLDAIKRWWKENGTALIVGAALAAAGVFGWKYWQDYQHNQAVAASVTYQQLLDLASRNQLDDSARAQAKQLSEQLGNEHGDSLYTDLGLLLNARVQVDAGEFEAAKSSLETLINDDNDAYIVGIARLRLARLQSAQGENDAALATLDGDIPDTLAAQRANIRGDVYYANGQQDLAGEAWNEAQNLSEQSGQPLYGIALKLDNLGDKEVTL